MYNRRQKEQVEQRNYVIRPALKEKFTKNVFKFIIIILIIHSLFFQKVYDLIYKSLEDNLKELQYNADSIIALNKTICDEVKNKLKEDSMNFKRYKILVHCIIAKESLNTLQKVRKEDQE